LFSILYQKHRFLGFRSNLNYDNYDEKKEHKNQSNQMSNQNRKKNPAYFTKNQILIR